MFSVNLFVKPLDGILVGITNDAIRILNPGASISLTSNLWFSIASVFLLTIVVSLVNDKLIEPRLGPYAGGAQPESTGTSSEEARGLKYALWALIGTLIVFGLLTLLPGAPLRNPETGAIIGDSPFHEWPDRLHRAGVSRGGRVRHRRRCFLTTGSSTAWRSSANRRGTSPPGS